MHCSAHRPLGARCAINTIKRPTSVNRPNTIKPNLQVIKAFDWNTIQYESYLIGKSIFVFTMVYCGLNWAHYRSMRKGQDDADADDHR
jgi:hypothetical protein